MTSYVTDYIIIRFITLYLIKYLNYVIKVNIHQLICQFIEKIKKIKVILKYNYYFKRKVDEINFFLINIYNIYYIFYYYYLKKIY